MSLVHLLREASHEIQRLRRANELLSAKVEVLDIFKAALLGVSRGGGMSSDVAWALDRAALELEGKAPADDLAADLDADQGGSSPARSPVDAPGLSRGPTRPWPQ